MACLPTVTSSARRALGWLCLGAVCALVLAGSASGTVSSAKLSARLTKTSFTAAQAGSVKLVFTFPASVKSFNYAITIKSGKKWKAVKSGKKSGVKKGSYTVAVKTLFAGKALSLGSYHLKISAGSASKTLGFTVIKAKKKIVTPPPSSSAPANTALPTISGTPTQGQTLSASNGAWTGSPTAYAYRWDRCTSSGAICADIGGATSSTYVLASGDVGSTIRVVVTATNAHGSAGATSSQTAVVAGLPPANSALPAISGTAKDGQTLSASSGTWTGSPTPAYAYQWRRCDGSGANCSDIASATASSYALVPVDDHSTIRVVVTATNSYGSLSTTSAQTGAISSIVMSVSAASDHSCAVLSDGKVECWGTNDYGQLGNGTTTNSATPVQVSGITTAVQVSAGEGHTCAVLGDQTVRCWGADYSGQLGNGATPTDITTPVEVEGAGGSGVLSGVTQVSAGDGQTCAVLGDHTVRCWGDDSDGELGDGNFGTSSSTPVKVLDTGGAPGSSLGNVAQVSAGTDFTCAVLSTSGWVYCWGYDGNGELGDNSTGDLNNNRLFPVRAGSITGAGDVSAGSDHACAVTGGAVWCWGYDEEYELGDNTTGDSNNDRLSPVEVVNTSGTGFLGNATRVSVSDSSTCALLSDSSIDCWGANRDGQVGDNSSPSDVQTPARVSGISTATEVSGGSNHVCALLSDHSVRCWGDNFYSQLGIGKIGHSEVPVSVSGIADAIGLSSGADHACAIRTGGTVWCWGENDYGQLGNGATTDSSTPVQATGISGATQVSAGMEHTCALVSAGKVWCWGDDDYGQLGDGTSGDSDGLRMTPVEVEEVGGSGFLTGVTKISSGGLHTCALITGGTVDCWGNNNDGELGNGLAPSDSSTPVSTGITAAIDISAGNNHACAVLTDHTVRCWGWDFHGQLGDGTTGDSNNDRLSPVEVDTASSTPLTGAVSVSAGWFHSCAVLTGGKVDCWGLNTQGQLGNSNKTNQLYAVQVNSSGSTPQIGVTAVSVGQSNSCALIGSAVECWGGGSYGQLGNGSEANSDNPTPVSSLSNVAAVSTGGDNEDAGEFACAIITGGTVECWGTDYYGELGDGGIGGSFVPVAVVGLP